MKQNLQIISNVILFILVGVLFYLHFNKSSSQSTKKTYSIDAYHKIPEIKLAFIEMDSLERNYLFFREVQEEFERRKDSVDKMLNDAFQILETKRLKFFQRGTNVSQAETENFQQEYKEGMLNLDLRKQEWTKTLFDERGNKQMQVIKRIEAFLKEYNTKHNFYFIFGIESTSVMFLQKDKGLDITQEIVDGLNKEYLASKK